LLKINLFT